MVYKIKMLTSKSDHLSSISKTHMIKDRIASCGLLFECYMHGIFMQTSKCMNAHTSEHRHTHTHTCS